MNKMDLPRVRRWKWHSVVQRDQPRWHQYSYSQSVHVHYFESEYKYVKIYSLYQKSVSRKKAPLQ